jgi:hypothetical protein
MSLDIDFVAMRAQTIGSFNITHNMAAMAEEAGVYDCLWHGPENGYPRAADLICPVRAAITDMELRPGHYKRFNPENGWGSYDTFLSWLKRVHDMCRNNPDALIETGR